MDIEKLTILRNTIVAHPGTFNMESWGSVNGNRLSWPTPQQLLEDDPDVTACIGGWAAALFCTETNKPVEAIHHEVGPILGLTADQAFNLFYPGPTRVAGCPYSATADQAVRVLDHLIETNEVSWEVAFA